MCCSVLQCVAGCCSALQRVAVCCTEETLHFTMLQVCMGAVRRNSRGKGEPGARDVATTYAGELVCVAVCCSVLHCVAMCCSMLQCVAVK